MARAGAAATALHTCGPSDSGPDELVEGLAEARFGPRAAWSAQGGGRPAWTRRTQVVQVLGRPVPVVLPRTQAAQATDDCTTPVPSPAWVGGPMPAQVPLVSGRNRVWTAGFNLAAVRLLRI